MSWEDADEIRLAIECHEKPTPLDVSVSYYVRMNMSPRRIAKARRDARLRRSMIVAQRRALGLTARGTKYVNRNNIRRNWRVS